MRNPNVCSCGNYGGGVHTRSARCPGGEAGFSGFRECPCCEGRGQVSADTMRTLKRMERAGDWWQSLHNAIARWSANDGCSLTELNKILAEHNPFARAPDLNTGGTP